MPRTVVPRVGPNDLLFSPGPANLSSITANDLGSDGTAQDGFDVVMLLLSGAINADIAALGVWDTLLAAATFGTSPLDSGTLQPTIDEHAALAKSGQPLQDDLLNTLGSGYGSAPTLQPPAGSGGGSGTPGTGKGGGGTTPPAHNPLQDPIGGNGGISNYCALNPNDPICQRENLSP